MSRKNAGKSYSANANVTTYSGFSKLRFWDIILRLLFIPGFIVFGLVQYDISIDGSLPNFLGVVVSIFFVVHILSLIIIAIMRNAYRV
jgi:hypothetical protein